MKNRIIVSIILTFGSIIMTENPERVIDQDALDLWYTKIVETGDSCFQRLINLMRNGEVVDLEQIPECVHYARMLRMHATLESIEKQRSERVIDQATFDVWRKKIIAIEDSCFQRLMNLMRNGEVVDLEEIPECVHYAKMLRMNAALGAIEKQRNGQAIAQGQFDLLINMAR